jgi:FixJ family two-component response regulator
MMQESYILVVDDESMITDTLRIELNSFLPAGLQVRTASSGPEALALIREEMSTGSVPAVAIVDYLMRPMKGSELLQEIEALSPTTKKIMLTGQADLAAVEQVMSTVRLYRYMEKPWRPMDMELSVNEALRLFSDEQRMRAEAGLARSDTRAMGLAMADQVLATKHKDLNRSLSYARTIQECFIPDLNPEISDRIGLHVMDRPLAEVSGDFRWYRQSEDHLYLALGDCTGHGLAGALIAVLATDILSHTLGNTYSTNPEPYDAIRAVVQGLKSRMVRDSGSSEHVGLDLTLVRIDLEQKRMDWSSLHGHMLAIDTGTARSFPKAGVSAPWSPMAATDTARGQWRYPDSGSSSSPMASSTSSEARTVNDCASTACCVWWSGARCSMPMVHATSKTHSMHGKALTSRWTIAFG